MSLKVYPNTGLFGLWGCESGFRGSDIFIIAKSAPGSALTWRMSRQERTFSCLKNRIILSSLKTRLLLTRLWKTLGSFFSATRFPSRGSVTDHTTPNAPYLWARSLWHRWQNFDDGNGDEHAGGDDGKVDVLPDGPVGLEVRGAAGGGCKYFS